MIKKRQTSSYIPAMLTQAFLKSTAGNLLRMCNKLDVFSTHGMSGAIDLAQTGMYRLFYALDV